MMAVGYNAWLVILSVALAALDAYVAFSVVGRIARSRGPAAMLWTAFGALAMGSGVWAMHFIGMLALEVPIPLGYEGRLTTLSAVPVVLATGATLWLLARRATHAGAVMAGCILGLGMVAMHYLGVHALQMQPAIAWRLPWTVASLLFGVGGSIAALRLHRLIWRSERRHRWWLRVLAALVMGGTAAGVHYLGMAAMRFAPGAVSLEAHDGLHGLGLGLAISLVSGVLLLLTLGVSLAHRQLQRHTEAIARELGQARDALSWLAYHDELTALPNRANVLDLLDRLLPLAREERFEVAVMFIDLDGFKSINDTLGHEVGDEFLRSVADALRASVRSRDTVARFGGDEFVVVLERFRNEANLAAICQKILSLVSRPVMVAGHGVSATPSIGVAMFPRDGEDSASLLRHADLAMYSAKEHGKAGYCFYQPRMSEQARDRLLLSAELRESLQREELIVYYQPKVELESRRVVGLEALARWPHPERGLLLPKSFVALAEGSGLIGRLGEVVLRQVARQLAQWRTRGLPLVPVAINVSLQEIQDGQFVSGLLGTLREFGLHPSLIEFEITESAAMKNAEHTLRQLRQLEAIGFRMAIDDFGTGFSSLSHLRQLPTQTIKIDQSFVQGAGRNPADRDITEAIIALARKLRLTTVAEGIETEAQAKWLHEAGCDVGQGFLFVPPLPPEQVPALLLRAAIRVPNEAASG
ncbi:putative bifunctional diguanylate cyclase/phosphodiesterase [Frateuria terrea]|uniref:Diguanylate cyclase (GGDEF) domain-containing protein n=1 Tax=Frateuria terrea TaxID=529704 RepID=A0A1H6SS77_9GAMM|nr:EAL domain-containing protein [Frateuria terrea]SEI70828.1 diguanylate cyclase (GGDEF) domain-containing protein [Frateuria terrea]SFP28395.1 diguanylate cyclase (GGDEF) domain-containing protein [Frateuria terrea]